MSLARYYRVTVWEDGFKVANELGLVPDSRSRPDLFEWYYTFDSQKDCLAFQTFLCPGYPDHWIQHKTSVWCYDPRC